MGFSPGALSLLTLPSRWPRSANLHRFERRNSLRIKKPIKLQNNFVDNTCYWRVYVAEYS